MSHIRAIPAARIDDIRWQPGDYELELEYHEVGDILNPEGTWWKSFDHPDAADPTVPTAGTDNQPPEWDWYDIAELARTAVKDAEQLWLKEGLPKQARLEHAISILVQAYPQLADYKPIATAFIREVIFNMNHPEQPAAPTAPQVLPMPDKPIASR